MATKKIDVEIDVQSNTKGAIQELRELRLALRDAAAGSKEFDEISAKIRDVEDSIAGAKLQAEDFAGAMEAAPGPVGVLARGIKQLQIATSSWGAALKATGVGLLVGLVAGLADAFRRNEEAMSSLTPIVEGVQKVFDGLLKLIMPVFKGLGFIAEAVFNLRKATSSAEQSTAGYKRTLGSLLGFYQDIESDFAKAKKELGESLRLDIEEIFARNQIDVNRIKQNIINTQKQIVSIKEELARQTPLQVRIFQPDFAKKLAEESQREIKTLEDLLEYWAGALDYWYKDQEFNRRIRTQKYEEDLQILIRNTKGSIDVAIKSLRSDENIALINELGRIGDEYIRLTERIEQAHRDELFSLREKNAKLKEAEGAYNIAVKKARENAVRDELNAVDVTFAAEKTKLEQINEENDKAQKRLERLRDADLINIETYNARRLALEERYQAAIKALGDEEEQKKQDVINSRLDAIRNTFAAEKTEIEQLDEAYKKASDDLESLKAEEILREDEYNTQRLALEQRYQDAKTALADRANAERRERNTELFIAEKDELLAYIEFTKSVQLGLNDWSENLKDKAADAEGKRRDRLRKTYKTVALAELAIGSASAVADIWIKYAQEKAAIALTSVANPALAIIRSRIALIRAISGTTLVGVQTGIAASKIRSEKLGGTSRAGVGGGGTDSSPLFTGAQRGIPSVAAPQINTGQGINPTQQLADTLSGITNKPIRAYVVSSDISSQQALDRRINRAGTFS